MPKPQCCRNCLHLRMPIDTRGNRVTRSEAAFPCGAPVPPLPDSVITVGLVWPPKSRMMGLDEGTHCATFKPLPLPPSIQQKRDREDNSTIDSAFDQGPEMDNGKFSSRRGFPLDYTIRPSKRKEN